MESVVSSRAGSGFRAIFAGGVSLCLSLMPAVCANAAEAPRIVNIYNFIRNSDFRVPNSEDVLFDCTRHQIELLRRLGLPATWALQYDALINPRYQKLLRTELTTNDEIAAWWEIPGPLAAAAGLKWRGRHDWDPAANVGFSPGYTPAERKTLVDVYMARFKEIFGSYPRTVGAWYIDEVTLAYMAGRYGVIASCNCKDQIGTDFYTLWGGYWNQAYYPSRLNAYMPAQTQNGQINLPVFRMLGSDPIYQHGTTPGLISLEPVYPVGGGSPGWVAWFLGNLVRQPCLAFAYTQAGQENSFGWDAMRRGFTNQIATFAALAAAGKIRVETLEKTGKWYRQQYPLTPATSVVAMDDWKNEGRKTVWFDSRYYRLNVLWENNAFFIRDLHCFDERVVSPTHKTALVETSLAYETLPVVDWAFWSRAGEKRAGMWPLSLEPDGSKVPLRPEGSPIVKELNSTSLGIRQALSGGGMFSLVCAEKEMTLAAVDARGRPLKWECDIVGGAPLKSSVREVDTDGVVFSHRGAEYRLKLAAGAGGCRQADDGTIQLLPNMAGILVLELDNSGLAAVFKNPADALDADGRMVDVGHPANEILLNRPVTILE